MPATLHTSFSPSEFQAIIADTPPNILANCKDVIKIHRPAVEHAVTPEGMNTLANIIGSIDLLGAIAIDGFYDHDFIASTEEKLRDTVTRDRVDVNEDHPLWPLSDMYLDLSGLACENEVLPYDYSTISILSNEDVLPSHPDKNGGHTFLSNSGIEGGNAQYSFETRNGELIVDMKPDQLVVIGGSAEEITDEVIHFGSHQSIRHYAIHFGDTSRILFHTLRNSY